MNGMLIRPTCWALAAIVIILAATPADAQTWRTVTSARQVWDREPINVQIVYGAGTLRVAPAEASMLYEMELRYDEEVHEPITQFDQAARTLKLGVRTAGNRPSRSLNMREGASASIGLTREVPVDLRLEFGAGKADIQLGGIPISGLSVKTGASETTLNFGSLNSVAAGHISIEAGASDLRVRGLGNARAERITFKGGVGETVLDFGGDMLGSANVSVQMGIGSVTLRLPRSHGVRINRSSFLTSFDAPGMERRDNAYYNALWESATQRLTIDIEAALGSIAIQWID